MGPAAAAIQANAGTCSQQLSWYKRSACYSMSTIQCFRGTEIFQVHGNRGDSRSGAITRPLLPVEEREPATTKTYSAVRGHLEVIITHAYRHAIADICHIAGRDSREGFESSEVEPDQICWFIEIPVFFVKH